MPREEDEDRSQLDAAHGALARAVAELVETSMLTEVDLDEVRTVTAQVEELTSRLGVEAVTVSLGTAVSEAGVRNHGNAVRGLRNPLAVVPDEQRWIDDERLWFRFRLGGDYVGCCR